MAFFIMEYRAIGYTIADALHRDPKFRKRIFSISSEVLGTDDLEVVKKLAAAREHTPEGYELFSVIDRDAPAPATTPSL
ncbi:hypothetical protein [Pseudomonas serbica]|jgi:hypothetical protein|uniref:hypothetical protein n=1 Tax=Pseudomonas serbica TaxID=2965074 RepID=UPI00237BCD68|nr:hypothetical protein [Pseudomonas serbica]